MTLSTLVSYLLNVALFSTPTLMLASQLPARPHHVARVAASLAVLFVYLANPITNLVRGDTMEVFAAMAVYFALIVVFLVVMVLFCSRTSLWAASFCAVVGYTLQNLGSGLGELCGICLRSAGMSRGLLGNALARTVIFCSMTYVAFYFVLRKRGNKQLEIDPSKGSFCLVFGVVLINIVYDMAVKYVRLYNVPTPFNVVFRVTQVAICVYALMLEFEMLYNRHLLTEAATMARLMADRERQYEASRGNIDAINARCHDIRKQIRRLEEGSGDSQTVDKAFLDDIAREVSIYDSAVKTGNDALDVILTEKRLLGEKEHITLSCIADGHALDLMSPTDLYSLFGGALENAFDAVADIDDEDRRNISLLVRQVAGMVSIHIENYYEGTIEFENGRPRTTKEDEAAHGFGIKTMQHIVARYGGTMTMGAEDQRFYLNVLIPLPTDARSHA
ncbi:MAG: ATP-binding protein [Atopobiaceae bacterium]|jgi:hypothetical protein|nr:ATP-binding protein [Atopobiaceae bacterium]MCI2173821.1 ATP-binding protein [Atopobiaceae bacterium]MCI2207537.1 ATP-binding protein [Atopobiaceae bacterium]